MEFWFELASPYSWLAAERIGEEADRRGVPVRWRPFLLGPVFAEQGWNTSPFLIYPAKGAYMWRDLERRAAKRGLPYQRPSPEWMAAFPPNTVTAARLALAGLDEGWGVAFVRSVYRAMFSKTLDIGDESVLRACLREAGADPDAAFGVAFSDANKPRLRENTAEAQARGLFGAPSFLVGDELFWGDDRLEDALDWAT